MPNPNDFQQGLMFNFIFNCKLQMAWMVAAWQPWIRAKVNESKWINLD